MCKYYNFYIKFVGYLNELCVARKGNRIYYRDYYYNIE